MAEEDKGSTRAILYALFANLGIAILKSIGALITGSGAMFAEAIHSFADCSNQGLLLIGLSRAKIVATEEHPFGYGKAIYFWSFLVALMLFSVGGMFSIYEGIHKWNSPEPLNSPTIAIGILLFSIVIEGSAFYGAYKVIKKRKGEVSLWTWFKESRDSELIVVAGEDLAAIFGLTLALLAVIISVITGDPRIDALGSILIGLVLILVAVGIGLETKSLLIGESASAEFRNKIKDFLEQSPQVEKIHNILTLQMGANIMVAIKATLKATSSTKMIKDINFIEKELKLKYPKVRWIFFEPDLED